MEKERITKSIAAVLNAMDRASALAALEACSGVRSWAADVLASAPFETDATLFSACDRGFAAFSDDDWRRAFEHHPRIGDLASLRQKFAATADLCAAEQSGVRFADEGVLARLAVGNAAYEAKFGHIFIICAQGKSAAEMLEILENRLRNDPSAELKIAAAEHQKISRLRLTRLGEGSGKNRPSTQGGAP